MKNEKINLVHFIIQKYQSVQYIIAVLTDLKQAENLILKYEKSKISPEFNYSIKSMELLL